MAIQHTVRRDTADNFSKAECQLKEGEIALETDTRQIKIGDGVSFYTDLPYITSEFGDFDFKPKSKSTPKVKIEPIKK